MGLLSKASSIDLNKEFAFSDFIISNNIKFFAILKKQDNSYYIFNSLGFDGVSLINSFSTEDFWDGLINKTNEFFYFSGNEINPFLQFFSFQIKDDVKNLLIYKSDSYIYLFCNTTISEKIKNDIKKISNFDIKPDVKKLNHLIKTDSQIYKITIDFSEAIETFLYSKIKNNNVLIQIFEKSIFNELYNRLIFLYTTPDCNSRYENYSVKTVFICSTSISEELLLNHLILNFKEVLSNCSELININYEGKAESFGELEAFFKAES